MADPAWKVSLKKYHSKLRTGLLIENVLPALRPLLTDAEYSCVDDKEGSADRVDELVRILLTKDEFTFKCFCTALETNGHADWASRLKGKGTDSSASQDHDGLLDGPMPSSVKKSTTSPTHSHAPVGQEWSAKIWSFLIELIQKMKGECPVFGILVVGETGAGKSTLINNLVGEDIVDVGYNYDSETAKISEHTLEIEGVPVALYDTPGLGDSRGDYDDKYLRKLKAILDSGRIHLVIYCLKLSETRMRASLIRTFQEYNKIGVNWKQTVIALTFADVIPVPAKERKRSGFEMSHYFNDRVDEVCDYVKRMLVERVKVMPEVANGVICNPSTSDPDEMLPNGKRWYIPFWLNILNVLSPGAAMRFLQIHARNMEGSSEEVATPSTTVHSPATNHAHVPVARSGSASRTPDQQHDITFAGNGRDSLGIPVSAPLHDYGRISTTQQECSKFSNSLSTGHHTLNFSGTPMTRAWCSCSELSSHTPRPSGDNTHGMTTSDAPPSPSADNSQTGSSTNKDRKLKIRLEPEDNMTLGSIIKRQMNSYLRQGAEIGAVSGFVAGFVAGPPGALLGLGIGTLIGTAIGGAVGFVKTMFTKATIDN